MTLANRLLDYPDDARLLIINADDFGMCHAINEAIFESLTGGVVHSTSVMPPCPWALQAIQRLKDNPEIGFSVHLTVICDLFNYKWIPFTPKEKVPSLVDEAGYCYSLPRMDEFLAQAKLNELEMEFRAQIEFVLNAGLKPTNLDWHCMAAGGRADIFEMTLGLAREYGLALRVSRHPHIEEMHRLGLPADEYNLLDSYDLPIEGKGARYAQMLHELPVGLNEWAVHPGHGNSELQAIEPDSWQVRQTDYDFVMSPEAREIIEAEGIIVINYRPIQAIWNSSQ